jgi:hypothetical protein
MTEEHEPEKNGLKYWLVRSFTEERIWAQHIDTGYKTDGKPRNMTMAVNVHPRTKEWRIIFQFVWAVDAESAVEYAKWFIRLAKETEEFGRLVESKGNTGIEDIAFNLGTWQDALAWEQSKGDLRNIQ